MSFKNEDEIKGEGEKKGKKKPSILDTVNDVKKVN